MKIEGRIFYYDFTRIISQIIIPLICRTSRKNSSPRKGWNFDLDETYK